MSETGPGKTTAGSCNSASGSMQGGAHGEQVELGAVEKDIDELHVM